MTTIKIDKTPQQNNETKPTGVQNNNDAFLTLKQRKEYITLQ